MIAALADWTLLRPWWLLALPLAAGVHVWRRRRIEGLGGWRKAVDPHLMAALATLGRVAPGDARGLWPAVALAAILAVALAGPARRAADAQGFRNLDAMALIVDLSPSMTAAGPPLRAQTAARVLLAGAQTRGVGLIVYAGDAYAVAPFTTDHAALTRTIGVLEGGVVGDPGSRPARALAQAQARFAAAGILAGDAVLISDGLGVDAAALEAAGAIRRGGGRVHTVFAAAPDRPAEAPPADPAALRRLAEAGGGAAVGVAEVSALAARLGRRFDQRLSDSGLSALVWRDWGRAAAALALVPALLLFRRRA